MTHPSTINQHQYITSLIGGYASDSCEDIHLVSHTIYRKKVYEIKWPG